jgi:FtsP/CotA-like multicopper oxidase with cupredoxin domain
MRGNKTDCFADQCITGDGIERGSQAVNRQMPGPSVQVCHGDLVIVDVDNQMDGSATTIHWHGIRQHGTPFSDGVPFVSQCPITYGTIFRYAFYAEDLGTHFWHSHSGLQKANGIYGSLIVRGTNDKTDEYEHDEFQMIIADWMHVYSEQFFPGVASELSLIKSVLINGRGRSFDVGQDFISYIKID